MHTNTPQTLSRRSFLTRSSVVAAGSTFPVSVSAQDSDETAKDSSPEIIDIHQHTNYAGRPDATLVAHQKRMGIAKTILLPAGRPTEGIITHKGRSNGLAARVFGNLAAYRLVRRFPDQYRFFANEVPDIPDALREVEKYLNLGAIGIGEQKFNINIDSAPMRRLFDMASDYEVAVLIHFQHGSYNHGLDRFHKILEAYPKVNFIGHAQTWWGNIDKAHDQKVMYPKTPVTPGGITDRLLADYPNIYGDLSAGSGQNSLTRDPDHAKAFLKRHADKLMYGSDCADNEGHGDTCSGAGTIAILKKLANADLQKKIFAGNARRILRMGEG